MEQGKKYISKFKGESYDVFINPNDKMDAYSVSVYNGKEYVGAIKGWVNTVTDGLNEAKQIILSHTKKRNVDKKTSAADGSDSKVKGTIKLAWLDSDKTDSVLHSKTFDTIAEALKDVTKEKNSWFIFKALRNEGGESTWELLPYGNYKDYGRGVNVTNNFLVKTSVVILSGLGAYFIFTKLKPLIFKQ